MHHWVDEELSKRYKIRKTNKLESLQREKEKIEAFLSEVESEENKKDMAKAKLSLTDRDARMVKEIDLPGWTSYGSKRGQKRSRQLFLSLLSRGRILQELPGEGKMLQEYQQTETIFSKERIFGDFTFTRRDGQKIIDWEGQTEDGQSLLYHRTHLR